MGEWPLEDVVKLSTHHHKEQGHVCTLAYPITKNVQPQAKLVAIATCVIRKAEDGGVLSTL